ncbi:hypothetical protein FQA39_LY14673 [Lamprigera yunnana]|nr:hypothetical protein FQA39_LY14673 [Lamprigera yunnana]
MKFDLRHTVVVGVETKTDFEPYDTKGQLATAPPYERGPIGVNEATVHVVMTLEAVNLEYFLERVNGKVNCNYGGTAPNVSGMHER